MLNFVLCFDIQIFSFQIILTQLVKVKQLLNVRVAVSGRFLICFMQIIRVSILFSFKCQFNFLSDLHSHQSLKL